MNKKYVEIRDVSADGFDLSVGDERLFVPYSLFPWFRSASEAALACVEQPHPGHLYWPELDIDLAVESIRDPGKFPLVARARSGRR